MPHYHSNKMEMEVHSLDSDESNESLCLDCFTVASGEGESIVRIPFDVKVSTLIT